MSEDYRNIMGWLANGTAEGLGFNAGSTFDPPNEMRPWRIQPDISFAVGNFPFDKSVFPILVNDSLTENDPKGMLPDGIMIPNLTLHARIGLPGRMDMGFRVVNMTTPKKYQMTPTTVGNGQSNTVGGSLRGHFYGGRDPLVSVSLAYNHTFGYFNFKNEFQNIELTPGFFADSENTGQLEWDVRSFGVNMVVSQAYGKWTPFAGLGYNWMIGSVRGRLASAWKTPAIAPSVGEASAKPPGNNTRVILGFQRSGPVFQFFVNGEVKATGSNAGKAMIVSLGLAAPFRIGANSSIVRHGRNRPATASLPRKRKRKRAAEILDVHPSRPSRKRRDDRGGRRQRAAELIFIE